MFAVCSGQYLALILVSSWFSAVQEIFQTAVLSIITAGALDTVKSWFSPSLVKLLLLPVVLQQLQFQIWSKRELDLLWSLFSTGLGIVYSWFTVAVRFPVFSGQYL